jgi:hypothetical protein
MPLSTFSNLSLCAFIVLIMLAAMSSFGYVQSTSSTKYTYTTRYLYISANIPITSKVISHNSSVFPFTNSALHILASTHPLFKVISYNNRTAHSTNTQSYTTTTNGTLTLSTVILNGNTSQQFKNSIVPYASSILRGVSR